MLSIIIPVYNESKRISKTLMDISDFFKKNGKNLGNWSSFQIILVSDGNDDTVFVAKKVMKRCGYSKNLKTIIFSKRMGKGKAVKTGLENCKGDAIIYDADESVPINEIMKIRKEFSKGAGLVIGSRKHSESILLNKTSLQRRVVSKSFNLYVRQIFNIPYPDTQCGFKGIKSEYVKQLTKKLTLSGFEFDVQLIVEAQKLGIKVVQVPVVWFHDKKGSVSVFSIVVAIKMLSSLLAYRFENLI